jgi:putative ABC transport system ATP-binding protein
MREEPDPPKEWIVSSATGTPVLRARGLRKEYGKGDGMVRAVDDVHLDIAAGQTVAIMGPSGTLDVLQLFETLHESGQTLAIVTHDSRIAATADRLISMRDGAFVDETRLTGGTTGRLGAFAGLED